MIISAAPVETIAKLRHLAGPNPAGSKLTNNERLHLIFLLGAVIDKQQFTPEVHGWITQYTVNQLSERGLSEEELLAMLDNDDAEFSAVTLADAIAVHPSLKHPYLD